MCERAELQLLYIYIYDHDLYYLLQLYRVLNTFLFLWVPFCPQKIANPFVSPGSEDLGVCEVFDLEQDAWQVRLSNGQTQLLKQHQLIRLGGVKVEGI